MIIKRRQAMAALVLGAIGVNSAAAQPRVSVIARVVEGTHVPAAGCGVHTYSLTYAVEVVACEPGCVAPGTRLELRVVCGPPRRAGECVRFSATGAVLRRASVSGRLRVRSLSDVEADECLVVESDPAER